MYSEYFNRILAEFVKSELLFKKILRSIFHSEHNADIITSKGKLIN